jgi:hypothetical protein
MNTATKMRAVLRTNPDGMTARELANVVGLQDQRAAQKAAMKMPDIYIDRWIEVKDSKGRSFYTPVWCVVVPPENCPKPAVTRRGG